MTKRLEELLNLETTEHTAATPVEAPTHEQVQSLDDSYRRVAEITRGLPQIKELDELDDRELDELAKKAEAAYDDLMDLGMYDKKQYMLDSVFMKKGTVDSSNGYTVKSDCYNLKISSLKDMI